jgi:hypothetical protein
LLLTQQEESMAKDKDDPIQSGVLGLGGSPVPKAPGDPVAEDTEEARAQRRARMRSGEAEASLADKDDTPGAGATGIDMGAGGEGTGVKQP